MSAMDTLGSGPSTALDATYGALLIGVLFATFFQGVLTVQAFNYYDNYPNDPLKIKALVAIVCALDTGHLIMISKSSYHYLVTNWGYKPALLVYIDELNLHLVFTALSCFICQLFFLERIWVFSKNIWVVGGLFVICLTPAVLDILMTIVSVGKIKMSVPLNPFIATIFVSGAIGDALIAGFLCYYLRKQGSQFERTRSIISRVLQFVVATGLATSMLAIAAVLAYFGNGGKGMYFIAIHFSLGRTYTNALLATLNARQQMRAMLSASCRQGTAANTTGHQHHQGDMGIVYTIERVTVTDREVELADIDSKSRKNSLA